MFRCLVVVLIGAIALAGERTRVDGVALLVEQLDSASAAHRESAALQLRELGTRARTQLTAGCEHKSAEVRRIAFALLNRLPGTRYRAQPVASFDSLTGLPTVIVHKGSGCEMVLVPAGTYMRGASPTDAKAEPRERPQERVTVARAFYLGRFELTYSQWRAVMGPSARAESRGAPPDPATPVVDVTIDEIRV